jgi:hypothetical protein
LSGRIAEIVPGVHLTGARVDRDDARLGEHDAATPDIDEGVGGAEIDGHVAAAESGQVREETHEWTRRDWRADGRRV